jgi:VanZ family protein
MSLITYLSLASISEYGGLPIDIPHLDKLVHFTFYFVGSILACFFVRERTSGRKPLKKTMVYTAIFMTFFGMIIEFLQYFLTYDRSGEILDFTANLVGVIMGLVLVKFLFFVNSGLKWRY